MENYRYGTIYVRKITKDHTEKDIQQALNDVSFVFLFFPSPFSALEKPGSEHYTFPSIQDSSSIKPCWYASAAYQASLVEPWFVFGET